MQPDDASLPRAVLEQIGDAVIYADTSGTIALWNAAAAALFGHSAADAVGQSLNLIIPEDLRDRHWAAFNAAMANGALSLQVRPTLTRAKHNDGRKLYVEMTFALVRQSGRTLGAVAVARDATERVAAQKAAAHCQSA